MGAAPHPTERELTILRVLWERGESTVREVYEALRDELPIVQNTVQAFLRTMEEKGLVVHRTEGRSFVYRPLVEQRETGTRLLRRLFERAFDGSIDQLVKSAVSARPPSPEEIAKVRALLDEFEQGVPERGVERSA